jgi:hypothetical protein
VKSLKVKEVIVDYQDRITQARSNLTLSLMVHMLSESGMNDNITGAERRIMEEFKKVEKDFKKADGDSKGIRHDIGQLVTKFCEFRIDKKDAEQLGESLRRNHQFALEDLSDRLDAFLRPVHKTLSVLQTEITQLQPRLDREVLARRKVIDSLRFAEMSQRRSNIGDAHGRTFEWILQHKKTDNVIWDNYLGWLEDSESQNIYWIRGKPGSGKSTLMRYLNQNVEEHFDQQSRFGQQESAQPWLAEREFLIASCYFWYAGLPKQKSLSGLLQSLLFQLYEAQPHLIHKTISARRWETALLPEIEQPLWQDTELNDSLTKFIAQTGQDYRILLIVDGLDEFEGPDEQREQMVRLFQDWTSAKHVKACLSSRPWNIYKDLFKSTPQLRLEDLTRNDIRDFVYDSLHQNELFLLEQKRHPELSKRIVHEIVDRADGVFLWVRLVVRSLITILRDGGRSSELIDELRKIPDDLDEFFMRMMNTIASGYRQEASKIMQVALCDMEYYPNERNTESSSGSWGSLQGPGLLLMDLYYLGKGSPYFCLNPSFNVLAYNELADLHTQLERRLNSRCMGLLELSRSTDNRAALHETRVEFIHRTVRDFLTSPGAQKILHQFTDKKIYDAHAFRCNALLARILTIDKEELPEPPIDLIARFCRHLQARPVNDESDYALFDKFTASFVPRMQRVTNTVPMPLVEILNEWQDGEIMALPFAIQLGWRSYVQSRLTRRSLNLCTPRPLLDYALWPIQYRPHNPDSVIVDQILALGADPNQHINGASLISHFLTTLPLIRNIDKTACRAVLSSLLQHGVEQCIPFGSIDAAFRKPLHLRHEDAYLRSQSADSLLLLRSVRNCSPMPVKYRPNPKTASVLADGFSIFDVLSCLWQGMNRWLFSDEEIDELRQAHEDAQVAFVQEAGEVKTHPTAASDVHTNSKRALPDARDDDAAGANKRPRVIFTSDAH